MHRFRAYAGKNFSLTSKGRFQLTIVKTKQITFQSFLKVLSTNGTGKERALCGAVTDNALNYWKPVEKLSQQIITDKIDFDSIIEYLDDYKSKHQNRANKAALTYLLEWRKKRTIRPLSRPEAQIMDFGNIEIIARPEIAFSMQGNHYLSNIYCSKSPKLTEQAASIGLCLMTKYYPIQSRMKNLKMLIIDTAKNRVFSEADILKDSKKYVKFQ